MGAGASSWRRPEGAARSLREPAPPCPGCICPGQGPALGTPSPEIGLRAATGTGAPRTRLELSRHRQAQPRPALASYTSLSSRPSAIHSARSTLSATSCVCAWKDSATWRNSGPAGVAEEERKKLRFSKENAGGPHAGIWGLQFSLAFQLDALGLVPGTSGSNSAGSGGSGSQVPLPGKTRVWCQPSSSTPGSKQAHRHSPSSAGHSSPSKRCSAKL